MKNDKVNKAWYDKGLNPATRFLNNGLLMLVEDAILIIGFKKIKDLLTITIPKGFTFDGASIMRILRFIVSKHLTQAAAAAHDYLYFTKILTRFQADMVFWYLMGTVNLKNGKFWGWFRHYYFHCVSRPAAFLGVRAGGWIYY